MCWVMSTTSGARWGMLRTHPVDDEVSINSGSGRKNRGQRKHDDFLGNRNLARSDNPEIADAALRLLFRRKLLTSPSPATTKKLHSRQWVQFFCGCIQATGLVWHHAPACMELPKAYGITEGVFSCGLIPYNALH